jgi:putative FmdB family regulatory protein
VFYRERRFYKKKRLQNFPKQGIIRQGENKMPLLQYKCKQCQKRFDELVASYLDEVKCPECGGETERDYSGDMFSATGKQSKKCSGNCKTCGGCR